MNLLVSRVADAIAHALPDGVYDDLVMRDLMDAAKAALAVLDTAKERKDIGRNG